MNKESGRRIEVWRRTGDTKPKSERERERHVGDFITPEPNRPERMVSLCDKIRAAQADAASGKSKRRL